MGCKGKQIFNGGGKKRRFFSKKIIFANYKQR